MRTVARLRAVAWSKPGWIASALEMLESRSDARRIDDSIAFDVGVGRNVRARTKGEELVFDARRTVQDEEAIDNLVWELARPICRHLSVALETTEGVLSYVPFACPACGGAVFDDDDECPCGHVLVEDESNPELVDAREKAIEERARTLVRTLIERDLLILVSPSSEPTIAQTVSTALLANVSVEELADRLVAIPAVAELYADDDALTELMQGQS